MNIIAKLKAMQREIEALRARVEALESIEDESQRQAFEVELSALAKPIVDAKPIASATIAPPPKKRGRPPKAT